MHIYNICMYLYSYLLIHVYICVFIYMWLFLICFDACIAFIEGGDPAQGGGKLGLAWWALPWALVGSGGPMSAQGGGPKRP